jgi:cyclophilin family peptidyl-prolyl cis-trans isomerase
MLTSGSSTVIVNAPLPSVAVESDLAYYRGVVAWAAKERWIEVVTWRGTMQVSLDTAHAPLTCFRIVELVEKKFFDGLTFHRVEPGFVIQGGDPQGNGRGGPGYTVPAEIKRQHTQGAMAMARTGDNVNPERRSSGSQFYICFQPTPQLDGQYTVIGQLVEGMDVLDKLEKVQTGSMDKPTKPVVMEQVWVTTE